MINRDTIHTAEELDKPLTLNYADVLEALVKGTLCQEIGLMRWGTNYTFLVNVQLDALTFLAIYKPRVGERPLWDFTDGTLCQRETAAWVISEALGWRYVPPTVLREGPRGIGSVQVFVEHDPQRHYFTFDEAHLEQVKQLAVFDAIINNADRKGGHCLLDCDNRVWAIDHGLTFHTMNKLRTVIWEFAGQPLEATVLADVQKLCEKLDSPEDPTMKALAELLDHAEAQALRARVRRLLRQKVYPMPGPGPNRPWPAV